MRHRHGDLLLLLLWLRVLSSVMGSQSLKGSPSIAIDNPNHAGDTPAQKSMRQGLGGSDSLLGVVGEHTEDEVEKDGVVLG